MPKPRIIEEQMFRFIDRKGSYDSVTVEECDGEIWIEQMSEGTVNRVLISYEMARLIVSALDHLGMYKNE